MGTLIHDPTDIEISFIRGSRVLRILEQSYFLHTPRQYSSLFKKKKIGEAFQSDHFLKRMLSSNIRLVLWLGGATPRLRAGVVAGRSNPTSKEQWLCGPRRA